MATSCLAVDSEPLRCQIFQLENNLESIINNYYIRTPSPPASPTLSNLPRKSDSAMKSVDALGQETIVLVSPLLDRMLPSAGHRSQ